MIVLRACATLLGGDTQTISEENNGGHPRRARGGNERPVPVASMAITDARFSIALFGTIFLPLQ
jgi:hypothetical protein